MDQIYTPELNEDYTMTAPLMPKATAVWLLENTSLTFDQIAEFCELHPLEIQALADGEMSIMGTDPITNDQLTWEEIELSSNDPLRPLTLSVSKQDQKKTKGSSKNKNGQLGAKYTPLNKRHDKPDAIAWIIKNHPELSDNQIIKLIGTTKTTIEKIRKRTHWNIQNIKGRSPVDLELCTEKDFVDAVEFASHKTATHPLDEQAIETK